MSLASVIRSGVAIANKITTPLQATVSFERYVPAEDGLGTPNYPEGVVIMRALVDNRASNVKTQQGELVACRAMVTFLDVPALMRATNGAGVKSQDRITLPDGSSGPILSIGGFVDAGTGLLFATDVGLG